MFNNFYVTITLFLAVVIDPLPSLDTQVMLTLILIDVQYSQKAVFSFEKGLNCQNHSLSGSHHPVKKLLPPSKISDSPPPTPYCYLEKFESILQSQLFTKNEDYIQQRERSKKQGQNNLIKLRVVIVEQIFLKTLFSLHNN